MNWLKLNNKKRNKKRNTRNTHTERDPVLFIVDVVFAENCFRSAQPISNELLKWNTRPTAKNVLQQCDEMLPFRNVTKTKLSAKGREIIRWNKLQFNCVDTWDGVYACSISFPANCFSYGLTTDLPLLLLCKMCSNRTPKPFRLFPLNWISFYVRIVRYQFHNTTCTTHCHIVHVCFISF